MLSFFLSRPKHRLDDIWNIYTIFANTLCKIHLMNGVGTVRQVVQTRYCFPGRDRHSWHNKWQVISQGLQQEQAPRPPGHWIRRCVHLSPCPLSAPHTALGDRSLPVPPLPGSTLLSQGTVMEAKTWRVPVQRAWGRDRGHAHLHWYYPLKCCCHGLDPTLPQDSRSQASWALHRLEEESPTATRVPSSGCSSVQDSGLGPGVEVLLGKGSQRWSFTSISV